MNQLRRLIIFVHRYLGIPMSVVFVVWFVSGIVMIYAGGMPALSTTERLARLPALAFDEIRFSVADAAEAAGLNTPGAVKLQTVLGRPAYRFTGFGGQTTVFADSGDVFDWVDAEQARAVAAEFIGLPVDALEFVQTLTAPDQWTLTQQGSLPLHQFNVDDDARSRVYVSEYLGDVALVTDRRSRTLAWFGTIPHWFYFTPLRINQPVWYWTVVWVSAIGCLLAVLGLILGVTQFQKSKPFSLAKSIRYRGWMRWHYISGAVFGLLALTWVFSGLLSMEPFAWTNATGLSISRNALSGGPLELERYDSRPGDAWTELLGDRVAKEVDFVRIQGEPYYLVEVASRHEAAARERLHQPYLLSMADQRERWLVDARSFETRRAPFDAEKLVARLADAADAPVGRYALLDQYDSYYYSRNGDLPLPVLRVEFDDPAATWYYVDPTLGRMLGEVHRWSRLERWLFNGLHSLDFAFWYDKRPLWDIGMILLSLGALATSLIGMYLGFRRLFGAKEAR